MMSRPFLSSASALALTRNRTIWRCECEDRMLHNTKMHSIYHYSESTFTKNNRIWMEGLWSYGEWESCTPAFKSYRELRTTVAKVQKAYCWEHNYMWALNVAKQREAVQQRLCSTSFCFQCYLWCRHTQRETFVCVLLHKHTHTLTNKDLARHVSR